MLVMCCNVNIPSSLSKGRPPVPERVDKIINFVEENFGIDLRWRRGEMEEAEARGVLEFTYFGPGIYKPHPPKFLENKYNCVLKLYGYEYRYLSITNFNSND